MRGEGVAYSTLEVSTFRQAALVAGEDGDVSHTLNDVYNADKRYSYIHIYISISVS